LLFIEDESLKNLLPTIFKIDLNDYSIIKNFIEPKQIVPDKSVSEKEIFIKSVHNGDIETVFEYLKKM